MTDNTGTRVPTLERQIPMHTMRYTNTVLTVLAVLLGLNVWTSLHRPDAPAFVAAAQAAPRDNPDAKVNFTERRNQMMLDNVTSIQTQLTTISTRMSAIENLLRAGLNVNVKSMPATATEVQK